MDNSVKEKIDLKEKLVSDFKLLESSLNGEAKTPIHRIRQEAIKAFIELGFPVKKLEEWKYTNLNTVLKNDFRPVSSSAGIKVTAAEISKYYIPGLEANVLVLVNGIFIPELSRIISKADNLYIGGFEEARERYEHVINEHFADYAAYKNDGMTALNTAFAKDGIFIYVPSSLEVKEPVHIINVADAREEQLLTQPRNLFIAESSSAVKIIDDYHTIGENKIFTNSVTEIAVKQNADLHYYKIQNDANSAYHVGTCQVCQDKDSRFSATTLSWGGAIIRNNLNSVLGGQNSECHFYGLYMLRNKEHVDNHTLADHAVERCFSNELYKGIMDDSSTGVFNGKIMVRPDAQKTNAYQSNANILLTDSAKINAKPQLEIFADDVKCSHGATTGQIDKDSLFYLRARGISENEARTLLLYAFSSDVIDSIKIEPLRAYLGGILERKLKKEI